MKTINLEKLIANDYLILLENAIREHDKKTILVLFDIHKDTTILFSDSQYKELDRLTNLANEILYN